MGWIFLILLHLNTPIQGSFQSLRFSRLAVTMPCKTIAETIYVGTARLIGNIMTACVIFKVISRYSKFKHYLCSFDMILMGHVSLAKLYEVKVNKILRL